MGKRKKLDKRITVRVDDVYMAAVQECARKTGLRDPSTLARKALHEFLAKEGFLPRELFAPHEAEESGE